MADKPICSVPNCIKPSLYRGWCNAHYQKWQRYGDPTGAAPPRPPKGTCRAPRCATPAKIAGLCSIHYHRKAKTGSFELKRASPVERLAFFNGALVSETDACIEWPFGKDAAGYGSLRLNGKARTVNYHLCTALYGPSNGRVSCHSCHNKACVNPRHLRWGTHADNARDSVSVGTWQRGDRNGHAKLTDAAVRDIRSSKESSRTLAHRYGITASYVSQVRSGQRWKHVA